VPNAANAVMIIRFTCDIESMDELQTLTSNKKNISEQHTDSTDSLDMPPSLCIAT
jgi:hypothetical protein